MPLSIVSWEPDHPGCNKGRLTVNLDGTLRSGQTSIEDIEQRLAAGDFGISGPLGIKLDALFSMVRYWRTLGVPMAQIIGREAI